MTEVVFLLGTHHHFQSGGRDFSDEMHEAFRTFVCDSCRELSVRGIAEECSIQAVVELGLSESVPSSLARKLGLRHLYADPDRQTRSGLNILQRNDFLALDLFNPPNDAEVQVKVQESHRVREQYWLQQLVEFDAWPVLFICGANHVQSFLSLLLAQPLRTSIVANDWGTQPVQAD